ncbi:MAG TPA: methyltransferase domain-containing protein [Gemmatimonadales bacterium]
MPTETLASTDELRLEPVSCALCGGDEAEPVAVGEDFRRRTSRDTYLAVRCSGCGLVYLTPAPPAGTPGRPLPSVDDIAGPLGRFARQTILRRVGRLAGTLRPSPTVLIVGPGAQVLARVLEGAIPGARLTPLETTPPFEDYVELADLALLIGTLEQSDDPVGTLAALRPRLQPAGRVMVIAANPGSTVASLFRGRHWSGYDFPRHRALADPATLARLAESAGFAVESISTLGDPGAWPVSTGNLLRDWGAPPWIVRTLGPDSVAAVGLARALEGIASRRRKGGLLEAVLKPSPHTREAR